MTQTNWHVITGGPGTGKTLLINMLAKLGYATVSEAAREIIDHGLAKGQTLQQIRGNEQEWQSKILAHILKTESNLDIKKPLNMICWRFLEICAPSWICSEPPSLKLGEMGTKGLSFRKIIEN